MPPNINDLAARLATLERSFERVVVALPSPIPAAIPEVAVVDSTGTPVAEMVQMYGPVGMVQVVPPTSQLLILKTRDGQDPVSLGGVGTPVALKAALVLAAKVQVKGGGLVIVDPVFGLHGVVISATGVDIIGNVTVNGAGIPTG